MFLYSANNKLLKPAQAGFVCVAGMYIKLPVNAKTLYLTLCSLNQIIYSNLSL